ncbi:MAG TPA: malto-oligosyltrehalose synthase [Acidimicrobiia bacterium]
MKPGPRATYRVQLHSEFGFDDAAAIVPYLVDLGVSHLYCSPYLQAVPGSTHGYDVVDPTRISDDLGGAGAHAAMTAALRDAGLGQVLDIVPNHMAADPHNRWWWDVLENGPASRFAHFFDIDWEGSGDRSSYRVLVPVLGDHYGRVLEAGEFGLERDGGAFVVHYHEHTVPVSPRTLDDLLGAAARRAGSAPLGDLATEFGALPTARQVDRASVMERHDRKLALEAALRDVCAQDGAVASAIDEELVAVAHDPDRLDALLRRQNYRLAFWRTASEEIDYRRFFNIDTLVGVRVEDPDVFDATHRLALDLVADGTVDGLRVDHVDGLRDPRAYLDQLHERSAGVFTVVEKILEPGESMPPWSVTGTTGYDFLHRVNDLFVAKANETAMTECYESFTGDTASWDEVMHTSKLQVMRDELAPETERVTELLATITDQYRRQSDHTRRALRDAVREFVAEYSIYRTYVETGSGADDGARREVARSVTAVQARRPDIDTELVDFLGELAVGDHGGATETEFALRLQQLTAPVMAKGVEDTAFYRYHRLISLNEVGGSPGTFGRGIDAFHAETLATARDWPNTMLTLSTHDTKRSADVRARINVLSEMPAVWRAAVTRWGEHNARHLLDGAPERNTEYLLYQTLVGAWPIDADRVCACLAKSAKEAKVHTSWTAPVADYDAAVDAFARAVLADKWFVSDLERFLTEERVVERGRRNSLAQTAVLLTSPGVPDVYQGSELWDLSLVDPDNRRAVDYDERRRVLDAYRDADAVKALHDSESGAPKQWMTRRLLHQRRDDVHDRTRGVVRYEPLALRGARADDVLAYECRDLVVVVPRHGCESWAGTTVELPPGDFTDVFTNAAAESGRRELEELFAAFPVAVLARSGSTAGA